MLLGWAAALTATVAASAHPPTLLTRRAALLGGVDKSPLLAGKVITGGRLNVARSLALLRRSHMPENPGELPCERGACFWLSDVGPITPARPEPACWYGRDWADTAGCWLPPCADEWVVEPGLQYKGIMGEALYLFNTSTPKQCLAE